jgi:H+-transporting ATPase
VQKTTDDYGKLSIDATLAELRSDKARGLSEDEVQERLAQYGYNDVPEKAEPAFARVFRRFWGPLPWMIEVAALLSALVRKWDDFIIIMALLFTNAFIDFWQEAKALNALKALKERVAKKAIVFRAGEFQTVEARNLVPGDIIEIKIGDLVPADVKLIEGDFILTDQSALTGESLPVNKQAGDIAYSNSIVKQGEMLAVVINTALNTYFGKTVALVAKAQREEKSHFQKAVIHIANYLIIISIFLAVIILITALFRHENMLEILKFILVLTVAAIPIAMPAVLTVTMAIGAMELAKKQAIVSRLVSLEELAGVDVLCSDKTGTLTENRMTVSDPVAARGYTINELMLYAALASKKENLDPIEIPIFEYLEKNGQIEEMKQYQQLGFTPFDPVCKRTEACVRCADVDCTIIKGAPQVILELCGEGLDRWEISAMVEGLAEKGYRTLGVARKKAGDPSFDFMGLIPLFDPPREDSQAIITEARKLGLQIKMVTGDNIAIARHIASILGIGDNIFDARDLRGASTKELVLLAEIISAAVYKKLSPTISEAEAQQFARKVVRDLEEEFESIQLPKGYVKSHESEIIEVIEAADGFAQVLPEDKYLIVEKLQKADHFVGMTGDGVNDAPALKKADAGIAVSGATDAARAAADLFLLAPGLSVIVDAIKGARVTFEKMRNYSIFRVAETIRVILFMTASIVIFNFYPVTAIMIIILTFLNDIPILTIAYDNTKVNDKPVRWNMVEVLTLATVLGITGVASSFGIFYLAKEYLHFTSEVAQSFIFLKLVVAGHSTIYVARTEKHFWQKPYPSLLLFSATSITEIIGTLFAIFGVLLVPIGWRYALLIWGYALAWFILNDFIKIWVYKYLRKDKVIA